MFVFALVAVVLAAAVVAFAIYELMTSDQIEKSLRSFRADSASNHAFEAVITARSKFATAVKAYEVAINHATQLALSGSTQTNENDDLAQLELEKDDARADLLDAQRLWEAVKPSAGPASPLDLWFGTGSLRGWMLGLVGYERAFIRLDHAVDPSCWAVWRISRFRFGLGLGAERQHLSLLASGADLRQLGSLISHGFDGSEVALRPGFSPLRWYRLRTQPLWSRRASEILLHATGGPTAVMWGADSETRASVTEAFEVELGTPLSKMGKMPIADSVLSTSASGVAMIGGVWTGRRPHPHFLTGSNHSHWRR